MRDIVSSKTERELIRVKIHDGNAFWNEIGVNACVSKLMLLSLILLLPVLVYAARHSLTAVRHKLMLPGITSYYWAKTINRERQIQALVDKKKVIITEKSVRSDLMLEDAERNECLPNDKKSRRKQKKDSGPTEPIPDEATDEEPISTPSCDPPQIKQLEKRRKSRNSGLKRLRKVGSASRVESSNDVSLGAQEDASKQERKIANLDDDAEVFEDPIVNATKTTSSFPVSAADPVNTDVEVVTTSSATIITTVVASTRPKAKGIIFQDQEEQAPAFTLIVSFSQASQFPQAKDKGKSRMLVEMIAERKKFFAAQRAAEQRSKPPTKTQIRNRMCTYLKNMGGYRHDQLKGRSYEEIQKLFDKAYKQVISFVPMDSEVVKSSVTRTEGSSKRAGDELKSDKSKKQKIDEHVEAEKDDDQEEAEMKKHIEIVKDDEVAINAIPLAIKPLMIVEYKIVKEGKFGYFQLIRADGISKRYLSMIKML
ncbi:hypothetical protein Tco_0169873 [Tanacetum coccineum]